MKGIKRGIVVTAVALLLAVSGMPPAKAAMQSPQSVRIGLFYKTTAVAGFEVNTDKGMQIGINANNTFNPLYEVTGSEVVTIRKDAYFVKNNGVYTEYNPQSQPASTGEKVGPVHIRLGKGFSDLNAVLAQVAAMKLKGVTAYPAYAGAWEVWTGFYTDSAQAQSDITNNIEKKLGAGGYEVVQSSATRIAAYKSTGEIALLLDDVSGAVQIRPKQENNPYAFRINRDKKYRGDLEVRRYTGSDMTLINVLPFDQYLYGVVPSEMESYSHAEALKAQAVASRTYAINSMGKHNDTGFDLCATTHCHVYSGLSGEAQTSTKAVDDTKGQLVMYNGKVASVFYFASSGGKTEYSYNVWTANLPYLVSVEDKYELTTSSHYYWEKTFTAAQLKSTLLSKGIDVGDVQGMEVTKYTESGRALELTITGTKKKQVITKEATRTTFGLNSQMYSLTSNAGIPVRGNTGTVVNTPIASKSIMTATGLKTFPSTGNISVVGAEGKKTLPVTSDAYTFKGKGWGHGVGMSQEGAKGMANAGFTYDKILKHYFPGTTVE